MRGMALVIELLGPPRVQRGGAVVRPRGRKSWAVLAYLLLAPGPPSRARLAELLFPDAEDPLAALRWSLSDLRRLLGPEVRIGGDPVSLALPSTAVVDVLELQGGVWSEAVDLPRLGGELLEAVEVTATAAFELWLDHQRRRLRGAAEAVLHQAALTALAAGDVQAAVERATRLVELDPLNEAHHVLLVRALRAAGEEVAAVRQADRGRAWIRQELGLEPGPALEEALRAPVVDHPPQHPVSARSLLDAGVAAVTAGAMAEGVASLRVAAATARRDGDRGLLARILVALGHALVHGGRGGDEEGGAVLHEAVAEALQAGEEGLAATAYRELAFADLQRGRYRQARGLAERAIALAPGDEEELAWSRAIQGAAFTDQGEHPAAARALCSAVQLADSAASLRASIFARSFLGRLRLLRGEWEPAAGLLGRAVDDARPGWRAFAPWPEALLAEVELHTGAGEASKARFERAFVMGRQLDDPCIESIALRGLGLVAVAEGRLEAGYELLVQAPRASRRLPDSYLWIEGYGLDALAGVAVTHRRAAAPRWIAALEALASRHGMGELLARAMWHRAHLGEPGAEEAARDLAARIDNPALHAELGLAESAVELSR